MVYQVPVAYLLGLEGVALLRAFAGEHDPRPGGHLVISDVHHEQIALGSVPRVYGPEGRPGLLPVHRHRASDYLTAALPLGLRVRRCDEPRQPGGDDRAPMADDLAPQPWDDWPWSLLRIVPAAAAAAWNGVPAVIVWHFQLIDR